MALNPGTRLGPYEVSASIGAGGMGEVYRARDTRLGRTVAIKVLPTDLSRNAQLRQRFEREARAVSSLNHPHICTLHDVGEQDGIHYLVMEHLEGETLAARLERGPLSAREAHAHGLAIADALDKAHRQGVIHRDLKPGNIMLTRDGAKLLDFGLAKSAETQPGGSTLTAAPTGTSPLTAEGAIVGTFQYMAPEQLEGKEADARTDIFAFGAVLYEMITGRRSFEGKTQASLIGAIMRGDPRPPSALVPVTPPALERLVLTCLAKDPDDRRQTMRDVFLDLTGIDPDQATLSTATLTAGRPWFWIGTTVALALLAAVLGWSALTPKGSERGPITLSLTMPRVSSEAVYFDQVALSPDGRSVAFVLQDANGGSSLAVRGLESTQAKVLPGTEGSVNPFWSPDSRFIGFFADGMLKKIAAAGGPPLVLCPVREDDGGTWSEDDLILFGNGETGGIYKVRASGGTAEPVTRLGPDDEAHRWPSFLPDGKHFALLVDAERTEDHYLAIGALDSLEVTNLANMVSNVIFVPPGFLIFGRSSTLMAQPIDTGSLTFAGEPIALADNLVATGGGHRMEFSASTNGILTYRSADRQARLTWVDPSGKPLETIGDPGRYSSLALSPDESQVAFGKLDADGRTGDVWLLQPGRNATARLTFHPGAVSSPRWSPDGRTIAYSSAHEGWSKVYVKRVDGAGEERLLFGDGEGCTPESFSPDGRELIISVWETDTTNLWVVPMDAPEKARPIAQTPFREDQAHFSPDGMWINYVSDENGREEVYVQDWPALSRRILVSIGGGNRPRWRTDSEEIYYVDHLDRVNAVALTHNPAGGVEVSRPRVLFALPGNSYAPGSNGGRFLVDLPAENPLTAPSTVVLDWTHALPSP